MESEQKRALMAVVLSGIVLFGWQKFFAPQVAKNEVSKSAVGSAKALNQKEQSSKTDFNKTQKDESTIVERDAKSLQWITLRDKTKTIKIREDLGNIVKSVRHYFFF